jgi:hypothetical protein
VTNSSKIEIEALSYGEMVIGKPGFGPYRSGPAAVPAKLLQITVCVGSRTMVQNFYRTYFCRICLSDDAERQARPDLDGSI